MGNGEWGSGKTYFIKKILKPKIEKKDIKVLYVSLNGVSSFNEIADQLFFDSYDYSDDEVDGDKKKLKRQFINLAKAGTRIASRWFKIEKEDFEGFSVDDFVDYSECLLVFDDLERLSKAISLLDVLGYINRNFIENYGYKILLIGDESKIDSEDYKKQKEKIIGRTVLFESDIKEILKSYAASQSENHLYHKFLASNLDFLIDRLNDSQIKNLRTIFFYFDLIENLFNDLLGHKYFDSIGKEILYTSLIYANEFKTGNFEKLGEFMGDHLSNSPDHPFHFFPYFILSFKDELLLKIKELTFKDSFIIKEISETIIKAYKGHYIDWVKDREFKKERIQFKKLQLELRIFFDSSDLKELPLARRRLNLLLNAIDSAIDFLDTYIKPVKAKNNDDTRNSKQTLESLQRSQRRRHHLPSIRYRTDLYSVFKNGRRNGARKQNTRKISLGKFGQRRRHPLKKPLYRGFARTGQRRRHRTGDL